MDSTKIANRITAAFGWRSCPRPERPLVIGCGIDSRSVERDFRDRMWSELPFDVLLYNREGMHWMAADAFLYYLPAFALAGLETKPGSLDILTTLASSLTLAESSYDERVRERIGGLRFDEKRALEALWEFYLELIRPAPEYETAMRLFLDEKRRMRLTWELDDS